MLLYQITHPQYINQFSLDLILKSNIEAVIHNQIVTDTIFQINLVITTSQFQINVCHIGLSHSHALPAHISILIG